MSWWPRAIVQKGLVPELKCGLEDRRKFRVDERVSWVAAWCLSMTQLS